MTCQKTVQQACCKRITRANTVHDARKLMLFRDKALGPADHFALQALMGDRGQSAGGSGNPLKPWEDFKGALQGGFPVFKALTQNEFDIALIDESQGRVRQDLFQDGRPIACPSGPKLGAIIAIKRDFDAGLGRSFNKGQSRLGGLWPYSRGDARNMQPFGTGQYFGWHRQIGSRLCKGTVSAVIQHRRRAADRAM